MQVGPPPFRSVDVRVGGPELRTCQFSGGERVEGEKYESHGSSGPYAPTTKFEVVIRTLVSRGTPFVRRR